MTSSRRSLGTLAFLGVAFWLLASAVQSADAQASKKISGSGQAMTVLSETKMLPGDDPNHDVTILRRLDTDKSDQFGTGQASIINVSDLVAGSGSHRGYRAVTTSSGDRTFAAFEGMTKTVVKPSGPEGTFQGKWWFTGGTGQFKGITGGGTYTGEFTAASLTYQYQGDYQLK